MVNFEDGERYAWGYRGVEWISFASRLNSSNSILEKVCTIALEGRSSCCAQWFQLIGRNYFSPYFELLLYVFEIFFLTFENNFAFFIIICFISLEMYIT